MRYLRKESSFYLAGLALDLHLLLLLLIVKAISIRTLEVAVEGSRERSLRRAIEVVKKGGAVGVMGFAATRRLTARNERRRSIVRVMKR